MRSRNFEKAHLVTGFFHFRIVQQLVVGQKFQIVLEFFPVQPGEWIEPLKYQDDFRQYNIQRMTLWDMNFFMEKDLVICFPIIFLRVDENIITKRTGSLSPDNSTIRNLPSLITGREYAL